MSLPHPKDSRRRALACAATLATFALSSCGNDGDEASFEPCAGKTTLSAEGSTTQEGALAVFNQAWGQVCPGKTVSYIPIGSGEGRDRFIANGIDFAGSDSPLAPEQVQPAAQRCGGNPAWNLPLVFTGVAMVYTLPDVKDIVLNADAIAKIFSGAVTNWNDPLIAVLNPGVVLPDLAVTPVFRADEAGITNDFQKYLTAAAPKAWIVGSGGNFLGGVGVGATGSNGVVDVVRATPGALGYVEMSAAGQSGLTTAQIESGKGPVPLTDAAAKKGIDATEFAGDGNDLALNETSLYRTREPGAYPLVQISYEIVCSRGYEAETVSAIRSFLTVAADQGQGGLSAAGFIPIPSALRQRVLEAVNALQ